jgi:hypothetical protein
MIANPNTSQIWPKKRLVHLPHKVETKSLYLYKIKMAKVRILNRKDLVKFGHKNQIWKYEFLNCPFIIFGSLLEPNINFLQTFLSVFAPKIILFFYIFHFNFDSSGYISHLYNFWTFFFRVFGSRVQFFWIENWFIF